MREKFRVPGAHSMFWRLFAGVAGCIALTVTALFLLNTFALKGYYVAQKQKTVIDAFHAMNAASGDTAALESRVLSLESEGAVSVVLWSGNQVIYSSRDTGRLRLPAAPELVPGEYETAVAADEMFAGPGHPAGQMIQLMGALENGWFVYLQSPVAAIEESVGVTNRFLLMAGVAALLASLIPVWLVARRYTRPVAELSEMARRMAALDFSVRYTGGGQDEVARLGYSINAMSAQLEETVSRLKSANLRLVADIRQKEKQDEARRAFIANVSHELKTPIALIGTYAEGLREDIAAGGENRRYYAEVIEDEARKIGQLLRRMTQLMQLEGGGESLEIERFDLAELVRNLAEKNRPAVAEKGASLILPPPEPRFVWADAYFMENVLTNYLANALHHVSPGGRVEIAFAPAAPGRIRVNVFNTGTPIPEAELPRIWESFYKVDKARSRAYGGSGIGLSVVAAVMTAHGMPYGVENRPDGVNFYIELETE